MKDLTKLEIVKKLAKENNLTAYEIGKYTNISTFAIQKILKGETKKPNDNTLDSILEFIEGAISGTDIKNVVEEPKSNYDKYSLSDCMKEKSQLLEEIIALHKHIFILQSLLSKNNIKFENYFEKMKNEN